MNTDPPSVDPGRRPPVHPARGWLLVVIGVGLSATIAYVASVVRRLIEHNNDPGLHAHWNGGADFTRAVFQLFGAVFVFGIVSVIAGIHILRTARIHRGLVVILILVTLVMIYLSFRVTHMPAR